jgi:methylamine dehydrogenase accessory protein MauD
MDSRIRRREDESSVSGLWLISYIALWILVALLTVVVLGLVRQLGLIHLRLGPEEHLTTTREGLEVGTPAPVFREIDILNKKEITVADLKGRPSVLVFVSPSCAPCAALMPHLNAFQRTNDGKANILLFSQSEPQPCLELIQAHKLKLPVISDPEGSISKAYKVHATPFAYGLDEEGLVRRRGIANDLQGLEALLEEAPSAESMVELPGEEANKTESS